MTRISHATINVPAQQLLQLTADILRHRGVPSADADYVAWHLVETNLRGTDSHGIARLPHYVRRLDKGSICARPEITFAPRSASTGLLEGGHGLGHVVMKRAVEEAEEMARKAGAGWVAVANSSHCGALAPLGLQLAERGYIGLVFSHVDPMVLPHGAREPFCGTNPICLTAPGDEETTLCLDMATSIVPWNVVANAQQEGVALQEGWAVDGRGNDTTDPHEVQALYPFGQHKGSGLGIMIDVFCSMLSGAPFGPDIPRMYGDLGEERRLGGLVGAIAIDRFVALPVFRKRVTEMAHRLNRLHPAPGVERVRFPGEPELEMKRRRSREGVPVGLQLYSELNDLADAAGLPRLVGKTS